MAGNKDAKISSSTTPLPLELILEIFSRVPAKSLQRLRCIFDDDILNCLNASSFRHKHALNLSNNPTNELLIMFTYSASCAYLMNEIEPNPDPSVSTSSPTETRGLNETHDLKKLFKDILPCDQPRKYFEHRVIGSSNGLICLCFNFYGVRSPKLIPPRNKNRGNGSYGHSDRFLLWNPCTREHYIFPNPRGFEFNLVSRDKNPTKCGFGYDVANMTYKLVMFKDHLAHFYDLSTNVWKEGHDWSGSHCINSTRFTSTNGLYLDGALHWIVSTENTDNIVSLDLSIESNEPEVSIWIMKEYGNVESWTNTLTVKLDLMCSIVYKPPLWVSRSEEMVFVIWGVAGYWFPKDGESCYFNNKAFEGFAHGLVHIDTLMSPNPGDYGFANADNN